MEFITANEEGQYFVNERTAQCLQNCNLPITVIAVAGVYRAGKSTLLNKLLGKLAFTTSKTTKSQTKGLWLMEWKPGVFLMDAEGLGSTDTTENHDFNIFALAVLLSSTIIYNNDGPITSQSLQSLRVAGKVANLLKNQNKLKLSPSDLIWLIRNAELQMVDDSGNEIDAPSYLECNIANQQGILDLFANRTCMTLPSPTDLEKTTLLPKEKDQMGFSKGIQNLAEHLLANVSPKYANGFVMNGPMFLSLSHAVVKSINGGHGLNLMPVYDACVLMQEAKAKQLAKAKMCFGDNIDVLMDVMDEYEANVIEPHDTKVLKEMAALIKSSNEQLFNKWLNSGQHNLDLLPPNIQQYLKPVVENLQLTHHQILEERDFTIVDLKKNLEDSQHSIKDYQRDLQEQETSLKSQIQEFNETVFGLKTQLAASDTKYQCLENEVASLQSSIEEAMSALAEKQSQCLSQKNEIERLNDDCALSSENNKFLKVQISDELENLKRVVETQRSNLDNSTSSLKKTKEELKIANQQNEILKQDIEKHTALLTKIEQERVHLGQTADCLKLQTRDLEMKVAVLEAKEEEVNKQRKRQKTMVVEPANAELQWLKSQHDKDEAALRQAKDEVAKLMKENMSLQFSLLTAQAKNTS